MPVLVSILPPGLQVTSCWLCENPNSSSNGFVTTFDLRPFNGIGPIADNGELFHPKRVLEASRVSAIVGQWPEEGPTVSDLFELLGVGVPVVLVHGSPARGADEWQAQRSLLMGNGAHLVGHVWIDGASCPNGCNS